MHTTELYQVKGIRYLLLGAGGAPQVLKASRPRQPATHKKLYWQGGPGQKEYSYLLGQVG